MATGRLTTHVLNTASGRPAANLKVSLYRLDGENRTLVRDIRTNSDGRADEPLLSSDAFRTGVYELVFHAGDYLKGEGLDAAPPFFLDVIPIRFGIAAADQHYHVPLLLSPYGYSTYRGS